MTHIAHNAAEVGHSMITTAHHELKIAPIWWNLIHIDLNLKLKATDNEKKIQKYEDKRN